MVWCGRVVLCLCEVRVRIICVDGRSRYLCIMLGGYLRIRGAPSVQSCCNSGSAWPVSQKNGKSGSHCHWAGRFDTICTAVCDRCDSSIACKLCRLKPLNVLPDLSLSAFVSICAILLIYHISPTCYHTDK